MKPLNANETGLVRGGQAEEFRTIQMHEVPRFENPPVGLIHETNRLPRNGGCRLPLPQPMRWLPPNGSGPQEY